MSGRIVCWCVVLTLSPLFLNGVNAQDTKRGDANGELQALTEAVNQLTTQVGILSKKMVTQQDLNAAVEKQVTASVQGLANLIVEHDAELKDLRTDYEVVKDKLDKEVADFEKFRTDYEVVKDKLDKEVADFEKFRTDYEVVTDKLHFQVGEQEKILNAIARKDSSGRPILALDAIMNASSEGRREIGRAVHGVLRQQGTLVIRNKMTTGQWISINRRQEFVPALSSRWISVPVGTLTTELVGWESARNWTINPPNYHQEIEIIPRPTAPAFVYPPLIVHPPIIIGPVISW